jgi:hypothetical protein
MKIYPRDLEKNIKARLFETGKVIVLSCSARMYAVVQMMWGYYGI